MKLSVCILARNEEKTLARALASVQNLADEIILVDTGSTDKTKDVARRFTKNIYDFAWCDDFSKARNFSLEKVKGAWILVLDADEVLAAEDHEAIRNLIKSTAYVGFAFKQVSYTNDITQYNYIPLAADANYEHYKKYAQGFSGYISCNIIRLFRNGLNIHFAGAVHESVDASCMEQGKVLKTDIWLHHYQFERGDAFIKKKQLQYLSIYENTIDDYPNKARAYRDIASIYYTYLQDYATAASYFQKSLSLNDHHPKTYVGLVLCSVQQHKIQHARALLEQALTFFPHHAQLLSLKKHLRNLSPLP